MSTEPTPTPAAPDTPEAPEQVTELDRAREWSLRSHYNHSDEALGRAIENAEYVRQALGITDADIAADEKRGRSWDERVIEAASMADGLRATASMTPADCDAEVRLLRSTPGYLARLEADPRERQRWRALVVRAAMKK